MTKLGKISPLAVAEVSVLTALFTTGLVHLIGAIL